jgi:hypothetical protein
LNSPSQSQRYADAAAAGVGWNRWPLYWSSVEASCGFAYDWSQVDPVVDADGSQNLQIDAILLATPACYASSVPAATVRPPSAARFGMTTLANPNIAPPVGLYSPTFADGTDALGPGKLPNPQNPWAMFVYTAVNRYHQQIHTWEVWNEPDDNAFWVGSVNDYARLLKVAYLAIHLADSSAKVLVGGMSYWPYADQHGVQSWLKTFLPIVTADPTAAANDDYFDVIPWHFYSRSSDVFTYAQSAAAVLASFNITGKELWLNESNIPACGDPITNPVTLAVTVDPCTQPPPGSGPVPGFGTITDQASFIIQAIAYAFAGGMTKAFEFQLEDDGNGQAFGMYRNDGSVRPIYQAYQLTAQYLEGWATVSRSVANGAEQISFGVPGPVPHRTTVLWNDTGQPVEVSVAAAGVAPISVSLVQQDGTQTQVTPRSSYGLSLPPATNNHNYDVPWNPNDFVVGGPTAFLVEYLPVDNKAPVSRITGGNYSAATQTASLTWTGSDPGGWGVVSYTIQDRDTTTASGWVNALTNAAGSAATVAVVSGHSYEFRTIATDWAGNVESKCPNQADWTMSATVATASTAPLTSTLPLKIYFPVLAEQACSGP